MPLHTGFHPTCAVAFCPIYDTARQNFASKVRRSSWENHLFRFTYCAMERRLKNCGSHCWHNFRFQRLLGMVCTMESKEMIFPWRLHNLLPQISPLNHLDKIPYPYYHKDTFSKRYRFSFSKSLMAFRHTFSEIKLLNFCRGKARVNLIWDFIRYIRQRFWGWK